MSLTTPSLEYIQGFTVTGLQVRTQNTHEWNATTAKLPNLWQQFHESELALQGNIFEVYSDYESDAEGLYTVTIGIKNDGTETNFPSIKIHAGNYLVFQGTGPMPATVINLWMQIWDYFKTENPYERNFISDFEAYQGADKVAIYIGIK